ncbi:unnamed protein product [Menidia menidia]|uniref:(Atlantic silverside) hypothetical protein n=1 Tax=Menidia menidia TaxID=238744 RepID=A0A8S4ADV5_9TELE|nr:unnamed protein product [Menidia menidia]
MDSSSNNSDEQWRQPQSSILNVFSNIFSRDRGTLSDENPAVLTSFKELSDGETHVYESSQIKSEETFHGKLQDGMTATCDSAEKVESAVKNSGEKVMVDFGAAVEPDLVHVTMVDTYSDTEVEDDEEAGGSSEKAESSRSSAPSSVDNNAVELGNRDEPKVPVFRTHKFQEKSRVESIVNFSRFVSRSKPALVSSVSKEEHLDDSKESNPTVCVVTETSLAEKSDGLDMAADENEEYTGIDCSQPLPSVISGQSPKSDLVSPLKQTLNEARYEQRAGNGSEDPNSIQLPSPSSSSQRTSEMSNQSSSHSEKQTHETLAPLLSAPEESTSDRKASSSPAAQCTMAPNTPDTSAASPVLSAASSSNTSPSKGITPVSSPPSFQMPALFSGLRVLKKGVVGEDRELVSEIKQREKDADLALLSLKRTVNKARLLPEQETTPPIKKHTELKSASDSKRTAGGLLRELKQDSCDDNKRSTDQEGDTVHGEREPENGEMVGGEKASLSETPTCPPERRKTSDVAYETFRNIFGPKSVKKEKTEDVDIEAVKKKIKTDKECLRSIFERTSKSPSKDLTSPTEASTEVTSPTDSEDRTPGRLQAVWPPPKPKDKEEKVGLKYTEAEHQAALLQLKRECKEDLERMHSDFELKIFQLRGEHAVSLSNLEGLIAKLQKDRLYMTGQEHRELCDAAVSTADELAPKTCRTVGIQTDRETFIKTPEADGSGLALSPSQNPLRATTTTTPPPPFARPYGIASTTPPSSFARSSRNAPTTTTTTSSTRMRPTTTTTSSTRMGPTTSTSSSWPTRKCHNVEAALRKPAIEPACPMKPLYWTRIQIQDNNNNTLWGSLKEPDIVNTNEFEDLFSKATLQQKKKPLSDTYEKKAKTKKIIKLLDGKRSQAVGILISSLHLEMKDIQQAVLTVDHSVVDLETIEALYENRATSDEMDRIRKHYQTSKEDEVKLLDKPEQFLYELSQIPDFEGRAHCIIFQSVFLDTISSIRRKVDIVSNVSKDLLECDSLRDVMGLVLAFGNYMNGGNRTRGQADGFGLEILPKLKDVKSRDNRINLIDYVVSYYLRNFDKHAGTEKSVFPLPESQDFFQAGQVKFDDLTKDMRKLKRDLTACEKDVQKVCGNSSEEHLQPFKEKMETFISAAQKEHSAEEERLNAAQKSFQDVVSYFGVKPKSGDKEVTPSYVFMLWYEFCNDFKNTWIRQSKNISKERLKEAQENIKKITAEKRVETKKINANSLKERLRQKEASVSSS